MPKKSRKKKIIGIIGTGIVVGTVGLIGVISDNGDAEEMIAVSDSLSLPSQMRIYFFWETRIYNRSTIDLAEGKSNYRGPGYNPDKAIPMRYSVEGDIVTIVMKGDDDKDIVLTLYWHEPTSSVIGTAVMDTLEARVMGFASNWFTKDWRRP